MKLATFDTGGTERLGIAVEGGLIDLGLAAPDLPKTMIGLIENFAHHRARLDEIAQSTAPHYAPDAVHLKAPVPRPSKILAIGLNYADHVAETRREPPKHQVWFPKLPNAVNGPFDPIQIPRASAKVDYEAELVFVIGKRCRHVSRAEAPGVVFGYCAGNDVSARDWQNKTPQYTLGKGFDTHAPFGPYLVTADEIADPHSLAIRSFVNGQKRQDSNTCHLIFDIYAQIAELTQVATLEPGDVIYTGTPGGVGMAMDPPQFLKPGDVVRVEIERVGTIEATMVAEG